MPYASNVKQRSEQMIEYFKELKNAENEGRDIKKNRNRGYLVRGIKLIDKNDFWTIEKGFH